MSPPPTAAHPHNHPLGSAEVRRDSSYGLVPMQGRSGVELPELRCVAPRLRRSHAQDTIGPRQTANPLRPRAALTRAVAFPRDVRCCEVPPRLRCLPPRPSTPSRGHHTCHAKFAHRPGLLDHRLHVPHERCRGPGRVGLPRGALEAGEGAVRRRRLPRRGVVGRRTRARLSPRWLQGGSAHWYCAGNGTALPLHWDCNISALLLRCTAMAMR